MADVIRRKACDVTYHTKAIQSNDFDRWCVRLVSFHEYGSAANATGTARRGQEEVQSQSERQNQRQWQR